MQIDESDEHLQNGDSLIDESFEPDSNVTIERALQCKLHPSKQSLPSFSTEEGTQILPGTSVLPLSSRQPHKSTTSIRTPSCATQFRGKTHPEDREKSQNAFLPSVL
jgi:hypothetical protein